LPFTLSFVDWRAIGATCVTAEGDLTSDAFIAELLGGGRIHALAHCAAILETGTDVISDFAGQALDSVVGRDTPGSEVATGEIGFCWFDPARIPGGF
jgi:hypothetical protein